MRKLTIAQMCRIARRRSGRCLSTQYVNSLVPLLWRCEFGHKWKATHANVVRGTWCPNCARKGRLTLLEMQRLAAERGARCLSTQYVNNRTKLAWRCMAGHVWEAAPGLVKSGRWCPHCAHVSRLSLKTMAAIASSRGGHCLSTEYVNVERNLLWQCGVGHQWSAKSASIRNGSWCPRCAHTRRLELREMKLLALKRGGKCLSRTYFNNRAQPLWECKRGHRWTAMACNVKDRKRKRGSWCVGCFNLRRRFRPRGTIEKMKVVARSRGGLCRSDEYVNSNSKLLWQCGKGHGWSAAPVDVCAGSWCPVCAKNRKLTLRELRSLAARNGGRCLSQRYRNSAIPLRWQCARGHRWQAPPRRVKRGSWCPQCANMRRRSPWRTSLDATRAPSLAQKTQGTRIST
jgi:hypothetical protein